MSNKSIYYKSLIIITVLLNISTLAFAGNKFDSSYFDISLNKELKLISKTEEPGFSRYVFSSSNNEDGQLQMRIIVSDKSPGQNQTVDDFQQKSVAAMSTMFMDSYHLYQYLGTPENKKELSKKWSESKLKLGNATYTISTLHFGNQDASFLVTNYNHRTYAITLISNNANKKIRIKNLNALTDQLRSIDFKF